MKAPRPGSQPRRGHRFALHLPVWYRIVGETEWHSGTTEDVSYSGVMLRTEESSVPTSPAVVVIALPSTGSEPAGCLMGGARVVRSTEYPHKEPRWAFAVTFMWCRLDRLSTGLTA